MDLLNALQRIASADPYVRREQLLAMLREMDAPFVHYRESFEAHRPENIIVSFGAAVPRYVIAAHYDNVRGSTGANDNGAGVSVLLALLLECLINPPHIPLDFAFFDLEEAGLIGSQAYLHRLGAENILGVINLDICGVGDTIVAAASAELLLNPLKRLEQSELYPFQVIDQLPPGDDVPFAKAGIPTMTAAIVPQADIELLIDMARCIQLRIPPGAVPSITETMHNGSRDTIDVIEATAMQHMLNFARDLLAGLQEEN